MAAFNGQLQANEIFAGLFNMLISQQVFADNIDDTGSTLVNKAKVDGSMYGDTKLYYATDVLKSHKWGGDAEATKLLAINRPKDPECQAIRLDTFRQIDLTVDKYLTKRAWMDEGSFSSFNSVMLGWMRTTKDIYDANTYNSYLGTAVSTIGKQSRTITLPTDANAEAQARLQAQFIAADMADMLDELRDTLRDYNDYKYLRSYAPNRLMVVWNSKVRNKITKLDLPTIFHKDGLIDKLNEESLQPRFFGDVNTASGKTQATNTNVRSLLEMDYTVSGEVTHVFPGDLLPGNCDYAANETYTENPNILYKVMYVRSIPYMSAFEAGTSFFNPKSLTENHYLTWGHNHLEYLKQYPMITVKQA